MKHRLIPHLNEIDRILGEQGRDYEELAREPLVQSDRLCLL